MQSINDINTSTPEGQLLWAAIVVLTQSPAVQISGEEIVGSNTEPDAMVQQLQQFVNELRSENKMPT